MCTVRVAPQVKRLIARRRNDLPAASTPLPNCPPPILRPAPRLESTEQDKLLMDFLMPFKHLHRRTDVALFMAQTLRGYAAAGLEVLELRRVYARFQLLGALANSGDVSPMWRPSVPDPGQQPLLGEGSLGYVNESSSEQVVLSDGRKLGVAHYGAKSGPAVFYLHGYPGCRLSAGVFFDTPGKKLGARVISVDRPGIGNSSPQPSRRLLDHANDIRELAEHLGLESYGVVGVSGGGPYALACAYALPAANLKAISIIGGMGSMDMGTKGMNWLNWLYFKALLHCPFLIRWLQGRMLNVLNTISNEKIVELATRRLSRKPYSWVKAEGLSDPVFLNMMLDLTREHYKQGLEGHMEEGRIFTSDWAFRLQDIRSTIPIQLWYSKKDTNVPFRMGEAIAARLPSRPDFYVNEDETHLNLVLKCSADALERLLEKM